MKKVNFNLISKIIYSLVLFILFSIAGLVAISTLNIPGNYKLLVVLSGSMEPAIKTGSVVAVKPESSYKVGDVITFRDPNKPKITTTHRVIAIEDQIFITKGDANNASDSGRTASNQIVGKVIFSLPYLGYPVGFAKTQTGLIVLIVIPAVIIIYSELINIKNESLRLVKERRTRKLNVKEKNEK